jgi:hypothetical protein
MIDWSIVIHILILIFLLDMSFFNKGSHGRRGNKDKQFLAERPYKAIVFHTF